MNLSRILPKVGILLAGVFLLTAFLGLFLTVSNPPRLSVIPPDQPIASCATEPISVALKGSEGTITAYVFSSLPREGKLTWKVPEGVDLVSGEREMAVALSSVLRMVSIELRVKKAGKYRIAAKLSADAGLGMPPLLSSAAMTLTIPGQ